MKTLLKFFLSLVTVLFISAAASAGIAPAIGVSFETGFFVLTAASLIPMPQGVLSMAIQKEIWLNDIVGNLFKANPHLGFAMNADMFVLAGKVVHIPNAGSKPNVERNRKKLPATVLQRNDIDITFALDEFTSDPIVIDNAEKSELSYDKRASVLGETSSALAENVGDWFFYYWAPSLAAKIKRTTGGSVAAHVGTGNRKLITLADVKAMQKFMNKENVPREGRVAALDADMMDQFTTELNATQYRDFSSAYNEKEGVIGKLYGFTFLDPRSTVLKYDNEATPVAKAPDAAGGSADNAAALFWQKDMVVRALGENVFFEDEKAPTMYGDVYSALIRAGGRIKRNDGAGVYALVQAAA